MPLVVTLVLSTQNNLRIFVVFCFEAESPYVDSPGYPLAFARITVCASHLPIYRIFGPDMAATFHDLP